MTRDEWDDYLMSSGMSMDDCLTSVESGEIDDLVDLVDGLKMG